MVSHEQGFYKHVVFLGDLGGSHMSRSRHTLTLSIATLLVLLMAAAGWCGGPVGPAGPGANQAAPRGFGGGATGDGAGGSPAFNVSGGFGSGGSNGVDSGSPWVNFSSLGISNAFAYNVKGVYTPVRVLPNVNIGFDYTYMHFTGSTNNYSGGWHPILANGQGADATLDIGLWSVTGDYLPVIANNAITAGPRLQWLLLTDNFQLTNTTTNVSGNDTKSKSMYGFGFAGKIDFSRLAGGGGGVIDPYVKFAAAIGQGADVRYFTYEIFASIFKGDGIYDTTGSGFWRFPRLGVGIDIGWVHYGFASFGKEDETYLPPPPPGSIIRSQNMNYHLDVPYVRGTVTF